MSPQIAPKSIEEELRVEAAMVMTVKRFCWAARRSAESYGEMSEADKQDEVGQYEYKRYRDSMSGAINLARELRDTFNRDTAFQQLILLLMAAKEEKLAKGLFEVVEVGVIRQAILKQHPRLAPTALMAPGPARSPAQTVGADDVNRSPGEELPNGPQGREPEEAP
jgi:hypothetical protein